MLTVVVHSGLIFANESADPDVTMSHYILWIADPVVCTCVVETIHGLEAAIHFVQLDRPTSCGLIYLLRINMDEGNTNAKFVPPVLNQSQLSSH